jgi:hypothetical protein
MTKCSWHIPFPEIKGKWKWDDADMILWIDGKRKNVMDENSSARYNHGTKFNIS